MLFPQTGSLWYRVWTLIHLRVIEHRFQWAIARYISFCIISLFFKWGEICIYNIVCYKHNCADIYNINNINVHIILLYYVECYKEWASNTCMKFWIDQHVHCIVRVYGIMSYFNDLLPVSYTWLMFFTSQLARNTFWTVLINVPSK